MSQAPTVAEARATPSGLFAEAEAIGDLLDAGRRTPISVVCGLTAEAAERLVGEVRRDRDRG